MEFGNIVVAITCWFCSLIFGVIALWAFKRKDPMHFWSGSTVMPEEIDDIPSYNRANGLMWGTYAVAMFVSGILSLFSKMGIILLLILCFPGIGALIFAYNRIYNKYKSTTSTYKKDKSRSKMSKSGMIAIASISVIIFIGLGIMFYYGEKEPDVSIYENHIQIKAMYGLTINFSEIAEVSLIVNSMSNIGIGSRTNGYGGFGESLKGNFKSDTLGDIILFVNSKSSPTIKIERIEQKDVYISYGNRESTEQLFRNLKDNIQ